MPLVHRCGQPGCREMIPLRVSLLHQALQRTLSHTCTGTRLVVAARAYEYHRRRASKHYDMTHRFAATDDDSAAKDLAQSFGLKSSAKEPAKDMSQSSRAKFYRSKQWLSVRSAVYSRDLGCCQVCGRSENRMYVDHIVPLRLCSDTDRVADKNLWTLCGKDHNKKTRMEAKTNDKKLSRMTAIDWKRALTN